MNITQEEEEEVTAQMMIEPKKKEEEEGDNSSSSFSINNNQSSSCPYAKAIHEQPSESNTSSSLPGLVELRQCPVFSKECPFKSASSPQDITEQLKRIPLGHMAKDGPLYQSLKYFHETQESPSLDGGKCPVKEHVSSVPEEWSFHKTVEELSLVSIMAEMALAIEQEESSSLDDSSEMIMNSGTAAAATFEDDSSTISPIPLDTTTTTTTRQTKPSSRPSLSDALKTGTASSHQAAEGVHFVKQFVRGKIDRNLYGLMIAQLLHLYTSLEEALDHHGPKQFGVCHFPKELHRREALLEDVEFFHTKIPSISPATKDYIDRIEYLSQHDPLLLLSHAYTRYLGDLSGGKVLARVAKRALNLQDDGLAFYQFPHVQSFKLFKDKYRAALDDLSLDKQQIRKLVIEANVAFLLNMRLFEELDVAGGVPGASVRPLEQVYETQNSLLMMETTTEASSSQNNNAKTEECPFIVKKQQQQKNQNTGTSMQQHEGGKCPWPFTVFHDRQAFMQAWQTWVLIGVLLLSLHSNLIPRMILYFTVSV